MSEQLSGRWDWRQVTRKRSLWWFTGLLLLFTLVLVLTPYGLGYGLKRAMLEEGVEEVALGDLDFNPFTGRLTVEELQTSVGGRTLFKLPEGSLDLGWFPLARRRVFIEQVTLKGAEIVVAEQEDGSWRYGGFVPPWEEEVAPVEDTETLWEVGARELHIMDSRYILEGRELRVELDVDEARLQRATPWEPERAGELSIYGRLNGAAISVEAEAWPFAAKPRVKGLVKLTGFGLAPLAPVSRPALETLAGTLDLDVHLEGEYSPGSGFQFKQNGLLTLTGLKARNPQLELTDEFLRWEGGSQVMVPASGLPHLSASGSLQQGAVLLAIPGGKTTVRNRGFSWSGQLDYQLQEGGSELVADGELELTGLRVSRLGQTLGNERVAWKGKLQVSLPHNAAGPELMADGQLDGGKLTVTMPDGTELSQGALAWRGTVRQWFTAESMLVKSTGKLKLGKVSLNGREWNLEEKGLQWDGAVSLMLPDKGAPKLTTDGRLEGERFILGLPASGLRLQHEAFSWQGKLVHGETGAKPATAPDAVFTMTGLEILAPQRNVKLLTVGNIQLQGVARQGPEGVRATSARLDELSMVVPVAEADPQTGGRRPAILTASGVAATGLAFEDGGHLSIDAIQLRGANALLHRNRDGRWYLIQDMVVPTERSATPDGDKQPETSTAEGPLTLRIGLARLKDSQLRIQDDAVEPTFATTVKVAEAHVVELNSREPERRSEVGLKGSIGKYTRVDVRGYVQPFADRATLDMTAKIDGLEMPALAPYTVREVGYTFTSGELDMDVELRAVQGALEGESRFVFYQLEVEPLNGAKAKEEQEDKLRMPIGTALNLLRDSDDNIRVNVPISGDISDPQFSLQHAINKAITKASRTTALTSLKVAIQPYGAIVTVAEIAGKTATVIRLDPIRFSGGDAALSDASKEYLAKVAEILQDRPRVQLKVCGKAVTADRLAFEAKAASKPSENARRRAQTEAGSAQESPLAASESLASELMGLAEARGVRVEDYLVEQHGIDAGRVILCRPKIDTKTGAKPRVDLVI